MIPTGAERAEQERLRAEQAEQQIQQLQQEKQETIARLFNLGLTQEQVAEALNLSLEDIRLTSDSDEL